MNMKTTIRAIGEVRVVDVSGKIELGEESAALRELIIKQLAEGHRKIILNLAEVKYIDSSGLGVLVSAFTSTRKLGGELKLLNLTKNAHHLMQITKLYTIFDIKDDEATAVTSFGQLVTATAK
jgi:anti-sigma B factor antagonist